jgi:hypothetical protein
MFEGQRAIEQCYDQTDPVEQLQLFRQRRAETRFFLHDRAPAEWQRTGERLEIGLLTLEGLALLLPLHDLYHLQQVTAWRRFPN